MSLAFMASVDARITQLQQEIAKLNDKLAILEDKVNGSGTSEIVQIAGAVVALLTPLESSSTEWKLLDLPAAPPEITLNFRRDLMPYVFHAIRAGRSCAVAGVCGAGLSNALRFVAERRVVANHLNALAASTLPVYLETGWLTEPPDLYHELIGQINRAAEAFRCSKADQTALRYLGQHVDQATSPDELLSKAVTLVCRTPQHRLILIFDEFDRSFLQLPAGTLRRCWGRWRECSSASVHWPSRSWWAPWRPGRPPC